MALLTSGDTGANFFTLEKLQEVLTPESSYLLKAPGQGGKNAVLNLAAGLDVALLEKDAVADLAGMDAVFAELTTLADSIRSLHAGQGELDKDKSRQGAKDLLRHFGHKSSAEERLSKYAALADAGSRLAMCAFACMELTALTVAPKEWGKHLRSGAIDKQHAAWGKFAAKPNLENLALAFAAGIKKDSEEKGMKKKKFAFGVTGDDSAASDASSGSDSSSESASSSSQKAKTKKRGSKKAAKKSKGTKKKKSKKAAKSDDSSDEDFSDSPEKKAAEKKKKTSKAKNGKKDKKKDKKKAKVSDSDSGTSEKPKEKGKKEKKEKPDAGVEPDAKKLKADDLSPKERAFTTWALSDAQAAAAKAETYLAGDYKLADLKGLFAEVPALVRDFAGVSQFAVELQKMTSAPAMSTAREPLTAVKTTGVLCEKWYASQQTAGSASGAASGGAAPAAPTATAGSAAEPPATGAMAAPKGAAEPKKEQ
ncbi:unnamed protein product [Prorocentrum cordatum]|uniref:Uncharacterized protein n=1 Tax=Prorocentrum cordatum TaxID=2364126 RepID=A0ABN9SIE4_9DINO|nr:unnamed protein product [Polarella glacialis]